MIKKLLFVFVLIFTGSVIHPRGFAFDSIVVPPVLMESIKVLQATDSTNLPAIKLLETALAGYEKVAEEQTLHRPEVITIIDFGLPSDKERLWVIDLVHPKVLFHCLVSHGRNSGEIMAEHFSNIPGSFASSPGFYITGETYIGKNGLSLTLDGIEKGINDKARERAIVMHGADYVSSDFVKTYGRLGRSQGCPAVPKELNKEIIQTIKGGSCLFIYVPKASYLSNSRIIKEIASIEEG